ncbi:replicative DNA helicase [Sorangium sp. So ce1024]|uniref:replicative DNA helicase n=1 Tax=Sorangium sp. So ce1024 TaxID=3133327 RepID=UPI003F01DF77
MRRLRAARNRALAPRIEAPIVAGRPPPHDLDAEAYCIESCINSEERRAQVLEILKPTHIYSEPNAIIYGAIVEMEEAGVLINLLSVKQWLRDRELIHRVGGEAYVHQLGESTKAEYHIGPQAERVVNLWRKRQMIATCQRIAAEGYGDTGDLKEWLDASEAAIYEIAHPEQNTDAEQVGSVIRDVFDTLTAAKDARGITGVPTGLHDLDKKLAGLNDGDLYIVAGRPGMGKSALVGGIAVEVAAPRGPEDALEPGDGVLLFSLEMPKKQLATRMLCSEARLDLGKMRTFDFEPQEWSAMTTAASFLSPLPIWLDDKGGTNLFSMRAKMRKVAADLRRRGSFEGKRAPRLGLVIVDYLQLMSGVGDEDNREQEIAGISRGLKLLAKEFGIPVIALSQLNRSVETRSAKDKRPQMSDLRESGAIEQDADAIIFVYRPGYYDPSYQYPTVAELIIAKQRNGPTGKVLVGFDAKCARFRNLKHGEAPPDFDDE